MTGRQPSATAQAALDRLRGRALPKNHDARTIGGPVKFPDGREAHQAFMAHLARHRVCAT